LANEFSKEEVVAFEDLVLGFDDYLVMTRNVNHYNTDMTNMERSNYTIWRPITYIAESFDGTAGTDISSNFTDITQLSVPSQVNINRTVAWKMNALELNDDLQNNLFGDAAKQKLASDINVSLLDLASAQGTLVVKRTGAAAGFADIAECEALMNEQGVSTGDRIIALSTRDYNLMAADLGGRGTLAPPKTLKAYEEAFVGRVAGFDAWKLDYANAGTAAAGATVQVDGADQDHTPLGGESSSTAGEVNVDNRYQSLTITVTSGAVAVGDSFTIAGVYAVHHITKLSTGQLKTFRIISIVSGAGDDGVIKISPAIVANAGTSDAEAQYQNVDSVPADDAALVFLNVAASKINPFWRKNALEILPGRLAIPTGSGAGVIVGTTEQGIQLKLTKQYDINTAINKYRLDTLYGVVCLNPEMCGIILFNQT